jgi:hypothetical protein
MTGIIQRPASVDTRVQRVGDILELQWRRRLPASQRRASGSRRWRKRQADTRDFFETLVLVVTVVVLAVAVYVHVRGSVGV